MKRLIFLLFLVIQSLISAQITDTLTTVDTSAAAADTTAIVDTASAGQNDIDAVVSASASDSMTFDIQNQLMYLYGSSEITYKNSQLESGRVRVNFETNELEAFGVKDTADTAKGDYVQTPKLSEEGQVYEGQRLRYNFLTKRGFIARAKNVDESTRYEGEKVKKVTEDTYFIEDGIYTTCDSDTPDTYFTADEMKVIQKDKVVAKWIFMYIGGVPLPVPIPFAVFPNEKGRRSGIITPAYSMDSQRGQQFRHFGYYFALSDYFDLALTGDYYSKGAFGADARFRYNKRYSYQGYVNGGYYYESLGESTDESLVESEQYKLDVTHNQQFTPSARLSANLTFVSSNYFENKAISYEEIAKQDVRSSATFSKNWDESGNRLSVGYTRSQELQSGRISETLPSLSFSRRTSFPFRDEKGSVRDQAWYEQIGYSYGADFTNRRIREANGHLDIDGGIRHSIGVSAPLKLGYFNVSPNVSYTELWYNKYSRAKVVPIFREDTTGQLVFVRDSIAYNDIHRINTVRYFNSGVSLNTKIYGTAQPQIFGIEAFRHTISPSIGYNFTPDFSDDFWGYYDTYTTTEGEVVQYSKYGREIFGGPGQGESQSISMGIGNVFEMKTMPDPTDTSSQAEKIQLLRLDLRTGYNFAADKNRLNDLSVSYSTQIKDILSFNGSSSYSFYDVRNGKVTNEYLYSNGKGLMRLTNFNFSLSTSLSGEKLKGKEQKQDQFNENDVITDPVYESQRDYISIYGMETPDLSIPWDISLNYGYSYRPSIIDSVADYKNSYLNGNVGINLTQNWRISLRGSYDFSEDEITGTTINIYRDLHCWEMSFDWRPFGVYSGFTFEVRMKAPELRDLKVTKAGGGYRGRL